MVTLLIADVVADLALVGFANRECSVPALPGKFGLVVAPDPFRGNGFQLAKEIGDRCRGQKAHEQVDVVRRAVYLDQFAFVILYGSREIPVQIMLPRGRDQRRPILRPEYDVVNKIRVRHFLG